MRRVGTLILVSAIFVGANGSTVVAKPAACPRSNELADLGELEDFVEAAGGVVGAELTAFFELVDENDNGVICFRTLPEATPLPTPPLLAGDDKTAKT